MQAVGNATFTQAVLNVINIVTGVGLLSVPFALKRAGWAGLGILWVLGFIMNYTGSPSASVEVLCCACTPKRDRSRGSQFAHVWCQVSSRCLRHTLVYLFSTSITHISKRVGAGIFLDLSACTS